jgi:hypothetical protein
MRLFDVGLCSIYKTPEYKKIIKYDWEHQSSGRCRMQRFDRNGNFYDQKLYTSNFCGWAS